MLGNSNDIDLARGAGCTFCAIGGLPAARRRAWNNSLSYECAGTWRCAWLFSAAAATAVSADRECRSSTRRVTWLRDTPPGFREQAQALWARSRRCTGYADGVIGRIGFGFLPLAILASPPAP